MNNTQKYAITFFSGILLQIACIIGSCITALSKYDVNVILFDTLRVPNLLSYILVIFGFLGLLGLFDLFKRK